MFWQEIPTLITDLICLKVINISIKYILIKVGQSLCQLSTNVKRLDILAMTEL